MDASIASFGLPDRKYGTATLMAMAIQVGVFYPITNPLVVEIRTAALAADLGLERDEYSTRWIQDFRKRKQELINNVATNPAHLSIL